MKIYTKTGDDGETGLLGGERVSKASLRIEAIGTVDELGAVLGWARSVQPSEELRRIQAWLFDVGAELASPHDERFQAIAARHAFILEQEMDAMADALPPLRNFILAGGTEFAARLHVARAVCRRAERALVELSRAEEVRNELAVFLNRLADWLFLAARSANVHAGMDDIPWSRFET